jgi:hypothetical protein
MDAGTKDSGVSVKDGGGVPDAKAPSDASLHHD